MPLAPVAVEVHAFVLPGVQTQVTPSVVADALSIGATHFSNVEWGEENAFCQRLGLERLVITTAMQDDEPVSYFRAQLRVFVSQFRAEEPFAAWLEDADEAPMAMFTSTSLPRKSLEGVWQSLCFPPAVKHLLLNYATSSMRFADAGVDCNLVSANRMLLLYGPPGTGKTSLCRGLAQQLSIRFSARFSIAYLVEVNAQALFSKWFSESAKAVGKMFERVFDLASSSASLVVVLVDEVESLVASRTRTSSADPSDSLRVVNSMLVQLDRLKAFSNVLMVCTSNVTQVLDDAFLDRADLKIFIGPPSKEACTEMLRASVCELLRAGVVLGVCTEATSSALALVAKECQGKSGRFIRKLPLKAHVRMAATTSEGAPLDEFVLAMAAVVREEKDDDEGGL